MSFRYFWCHGPLINYIKLGYSLIGILLCMPVGVAKLILPGLISVQTCLLSQQSRSKRQPSRWPHNIVNSTTTTTPTPRQIFETQVSWHCIILTPCSDLTHFTDLFFFLLQQKVHISQTPPFLIHLCINHSLFSLIQTGHNATENFMAPSHWVRSMCCCS